MGERGVVGWLPVIGMVAGSIVGGMLTAPTLGAAVGSALGGLAQNAFTRVQTTQLHNEGMQRSKTYAWDRIETSSTSGLPVPVVYGSHRVGGNIIAQFIRAKAAFAHVWNLTRQVLYPSYFDIYPGATHTITTAGSDIDGFQLHFIGSGPPNYVLPEFSLQVEVKRTIDSTFINVGKFPISWYSPRGGTTWVSVVIDIVSDRDGNRFLPGQYNIRVTAVDIITVGTIPRGLSVWLKERSNQGVTNQVDKSFLHMLLALSEGEIEGVGDIRINDQPVINFGSQADIDLRYGRPSQAVIPGFSDIVQTVSQAAILKQDVPFLFTTESEVDAFELEFTAPKGLISTVERTEERGSWYRGKETITHIEVHGNIAQVRIEFKKTTDVQYTNIGVASYAGKSVSSKRFVFRQTLPERAVYDVRITRTNVEQDDEQNKNGIMLTKFNHIQFEQFNYPNTALLGLQVMATENLQGVTPNVTALVQGVRVKNLRTGAIEWSNNPAFIIADFLTQPRYGLGALLDEEDLDLTSFVNASIFYDYRIFDGRESSKRFTLDIVLDASDKPLDTLQVMLAACRSFMIWSDGKIKLRPDFNYVPIQAFTEDNIIAESFGYSYTPFSAQGNTVEVQFRNREKDFDRDSITVETPEASDGRESQRKKAANLIGVSRWFQAYRIAKYLLLSSSRISIRCTFRVATDALFAEPGDAITVTHRVAGWTRKEFRITKIEEVNAFELSLDCVEQVSTVFDESVIEPPQPTFAVQANPNTVPPSVEGLEVTETFVATSPGRSELVVSFRPPTGSDVDWAGAKIYMARNEDIIERNGDIESSAELLGETRSGEFIIPNVVRDSGTWIYALSFNSRGVAQTFNSPGIPKTYIYPLGKTTRPPNVSRFWAVQVEKMVYFKWVPVSDPGTPITYIIRAGTDWDSAIEIADVSGSSQLAIPFFQIGAMNYLIKAHDAWGNVSEDATATTLNVAGIRGRQVKIDYDEVDNPNGTFDGAKIKDPISSPVNKQVLAIEVTTEFDDITFDDPDTFWDVPVASSGEYTTQAIDLGKYICFELHTDIGLAVPPQSWCGWISTPMEPARGEWAGGSPGQWNEPGEPVGLLTQEVAGVTPAVIVGTLQDESAVLTGLSSGLPNTALDSFEDVSYLPAGTKIDIRVPFPSGQLAADIKAFQESGGFPEGPGDHDRRHEVWTHSIILSTERFGPMSLDGLLVEFGLLREELRDANEALWDTIVGLSPGGTLTLPHPAKLSFLNQKETLPPVRDDDGFPPVPRVAFCPRWGLDGNAWSALNPHDVQLSISLSEDGVTFGPFTDISSGGEFCTRAFKLKLRMETAIPNISPEVWKFKVQVDFPERVDSAQVFVPAAETQVVFEDEFFEVPDLTVTPVFVGATQALSPIVSTVSSTGFFVQVRDNQNNLAATNVSYHAVGV